MRLRAQDERRRGRRWSPVPFLFLFFISFSAPLFLFVLGKKKKRRGRCKKKNRLPFCWSVLLFPARTTGYGHHRYRARYFAFARRADRFLFYRWSACLFAEAGCGVLRARRACLFAVSEERCTIECSPGGASKRGAAAPICWSLSRGFPKGGNRNPPLGASLVPFCASRKEHPP